MSVHHDAGAERAILAACLADGAEALDRLDGLEAVEFFAPARAATFAALRRLYASGTAIELTTLRSELARMGDLDRAGGDERLLEITDTIPTAPVETYAARVRELARVRRVVAAAREVQTAAADPIQDVDGFIAAAARAVVDACTDERAEGAMVRIGETVDGVIAGWRERVDTGKAPGLSTGLSLLDVQIGGLEAGHLVIVAGRPGMGKSALAQKLMLAAAQSGEGTALAFSLEMQSSEWTSRMLLSEADVDGERTKRGTLNARDFERLAAAAERLRGLPIVVDDTPGISPIDLRTRARRLHRRERLALIVVDYMQLMRVPEIRKAEKEAIVAECSQSLKELAKELGVPVVALAQLNRDVEKRPDKRPMLSDLRHSGQIEQDADVVLFPFRPSQYSADVGANPREAEIIVAKQRSGPTGSIPVEFVASSFRFQDAPRDAKPTTAAPAQTDFEDPEW